ncbi:hypothetical protein C8J56DRAFT_920347 [Mycena floridula]|nr:hypothetical protein C8J56DRAFT_920347 [Mycena floridula]
MWLEARATAVEAALAVSSSEAASLHGKKAKTPIIAGVVCGTVMGLAWIIGFAIYFTKRYQRKKRKRLAEAEGKASEEAAKKAKSDRPEEKIIIPPDPAVLSGAHQPGERIIIEKRKSHSRNPSESRKIHSRHPSESRKSLSRNPSTSMPNDSDTLPLNSST